jgi:lipoprotein-anchoring transpeptidase ErfK/SrfK
MPGRNRQGTAMNLVFQGRFVRLLSIGRGSVRRVATAACTALALGGLVATLAYAAETQIFDSQTHKWVDYDRTKAWKYYSTHKQVPEAFLRQVVSFKTAEKPGTIIVDGNQHFLYLVQPGFTAIRYGIGVGREGFGWAGIVRVGRTAEWPSWTPPPEMVARDPKAAKYAGGMEGGPDNPLGARALYLYSGDEDIGYRIHGTPEPWSIGLNVSSGCIRLNNDDVVDLYGRVKVGAKVIVLMQGAALYKGV